MAAAEEEAEQRLPSVLLLRPVSPSFHGAVSQKFRLLKPWEQPSVPAHVFLSTHARSVRALLSIGSLAPVDSAVLRCLPSLELVLTLSAGVNHIDVAECRRRGIAVANSGSAFSEDVADYAVGLLIDVFRRMSASDRYLRQALWPSQGDYPLGSKIRGKKVGIVGLGRIGSEIAKRLEAFGCNIAYNSRRKKLVSFPYFPKVLDLAAHCDVIILACALTDETHCMVNKDVLAALGKEGVIINIARGKLVDEKELVRCLVQGEIGGAGLDAFENEPSVPRELFTLNNVVLSPHCAFATPESFSSMLDVIMGNLEAFFSNKPLLNPVEE
ncbi:hypothetical protein ACLOJK_020855 [Asimina triloba]